VLIEHKAGEISNVFSERASLKEMLPRKRKGTYFSFFFALHRGRDVVKLRLHACVCVSAV